MKIECPTSVEADWIAQELWLIARRYPPNPELFYRAVCLLLLGARAVASEEP
jgi:hypothetical protein